MKKILLIGLVATTLFGCGINKQAQQIKALEKCTYKITSADSLYIAGTDVNKLISNNSIDLGRMPGIALGYLRKNIPFEGRINLEISNPSPVQAAINQFEYKILIKDQELANGFVNQKVDVSPGGKTNVPVKVNVNIFQFLSNGKTLQEITDFVKGGTSGGTEKKGVVTLKIRPSILVGGELIKYPGFITINKEVSSKILF